MEDVQRKNLEMQIANKQQKLTYSRSIVPTSIEDPRVFAVLNERQILTGDADIDQMIKKITYDDSPSKELDLHIATRANPKYHSLLGQNQHHTRTEKTIKMSSSSGAINIYKNVQMEGILNEISRSDFDATQKKHI